MFAALSNSSEQRLWAHQVDALNFAIEHLNRSESPCLIRMPTGTGKTGVVACLSRLANPGSSLVLTPWANLRVQMIEDLEGRFWKEVRLTPGRQKVVALLPSTARKVLSFREPQVLVATFTTLNELRRECEPLYKQLAGSISMVIVDECHYEPAVEWGKSVKGLNVRTVLLTATPYRNDLKLFRISDPKTSTHHFTHQEAVRRKIIRPLSFQALSSSTAIGDLSAEFARRWKAVKEGGVLPVAAPRAIICCSGALDIESAVRHLRRRGLNAIGIHEQFEGSKSRILLKDVPSTKHQEAEIWVHQHKLTEGLDDHRFSCVALFTRIRNDRKLVQQIGRILRRKANDKAKPAILFAPPEFSVEGEWEAYLEFETNLELLDPAHFRDVVDAMLQSQPSVEYFDGKFRRRFNPSSLPQRPQVIVTPSVLVRRASTTFSLSGYLEDCTDTLNTEDAVILGPETNAPCMRTDDSALWVYASVGNSRYLQNTSLYEIKLETHCVVVAHGYVLVADSRGILPREYLEDHTGSVPEDKLVRFLDASFRPTHVSVNTSIPYDTVLRGADLHGHNLLTIPASLTDRVQICRAARGVSRDAGRRYVGMRSGRLRKEETADERRTFDPTMFVTWAKSVAAVLDSNITASDLFNRYMRACDPPSSPIPKTICVDLLRLNLDVSLDGQECALHTSSTNIEATNGDRTQHFGFSFDVVPRKGEPQTLTLKLSYDPSKKRFWFNKERGPAVEVALPGAQAAAAKGLAEFLNQNQDLVLIGLEGGEIVYQGRNFYRIDYAYAESALIDLIVRPPNIGECATEKGTRGEIAAARQTRATRFPTHSVFRAVADRQLRLPFVDELLICADLGTECADFIAANFGRRQLALIHAKAGSGSQISASAFHDVAAQAMKNLGYLTRNAEVPKGVTSWHREGLWNNTGVHRLYRAPVGMPFRRTLWNKLKSEILGDSNPELYVVLATTGCCDVRRLREAVRDPARRTPEIAQLLHLLDGLNGYARQLGVRLLIYDIPFAEEEQEEGAVA